MNDARKYDLSNPGGQPKDWLDKAREPSDGWRVAAWVIGLLLLGGASIYLLVSGLFF